MPQCITDVKADVSQDSYSTHLPWGVASNSMAFTTTSADPTSITLSIFRDISNVPVPEIEPTQLSFLLISWMASVPTPAHLTARNLRASLTPLQEAVSLLNRTGRLPGAAVHIAGAGLVHWPIQGLEPTGKQKCCLLSVSCLQVPMWLGAWEAASLSLVFLPHWQVLKMLNLRNLWDGGHGSLVYSLSLLIGCFRSNLDGRTCYITSPILQLGSVSCV